jgi:hypothetical protein
VTEARRGVIRRMFQRRPSTPDDEAGRTSALEVLIAVTLGVAAVLTAYAAYATSLADGDTLKAFQEGSAIYDDANQQYLEGNQQVANDVNVFTQYAIAAEQGNEDLAAYIKEGLMDESLLAATEEWEEADGDLPSAIEAESYEVAAYEEAEKLVAQGDALFDEANAKDKEGDEFTLATVILAIALFFGGVAGVTRSHLISVAMTLMAIVLTVGSGIYIAPI